MRFSFCRVNYFSASSSLFLDGGVLGSVDRKQGFFAGGDRTVECGSGDLGLTPSVIVNAVGFVDGTSSSAETLLGGGECGGHADTEAEAREATAAATAAEKGA